MSKGPALESEMISGLYVALVIILSFCFYIPAIIDLARNVGNDGTGLADLLEVTGIEICPILLLVAFRRGFRG